MRLNVLTDNSRWIAFQNTPEPYQWHWTVDILSMFEIRMLLNWHFPITESVRSRLVIKIACAQYSKCVNLTTFLPYLSPLDYTVILPDERNEITTANMRNGITKTWSRWKTRFFVIAIHRNQSFGNNIYTRNTSSI